MKTPDLDRERSEKTRLLSDFLKQYNESLPPNFTPASIELLQEFREGHKTLFSRGRYWSLDLHRKKVMDWLSSRREPAS